jgi:hypothetical protein
MRSIAIAAMGSSRTSRTGPDWRAIATDMSANYLFHNLGGFRFEETGQVAGAAASADGLYK